MRNCFVQRTPHRTSGCGNELRAYMYVRSTEYQVEQYRSCRTKKDNLKNCISVHALQQIYLETQRARFQYSIIQSDARIFSSFAISMLFCDAIFCFYINLILLQYEFLFWIIYSTSENYITKCNAKRFNMTSTCKIVEITEEEMSKVLSPITLEKRAWNFGLLCINGYKYFHYRS